MSFTDEQRDERAEGYRNARALDLAKAHHAAMGPAMRATTGQNVIVKDWLSMPKETRDTMVAVMRDLLDQGVVA